MHHRCLGLMSKEEMQEEALLSKVHPALRIIVEKLLESDVGASGLVELKTVSTESDTLDEDKSNGDIFTFSIPYAGTFHAWELMFQGQHPDRPPDFLCTSDEFEYEPDTYTNVMKSWDQKDLYCLRNLTKQLIRIYKHFQIQKLKDFPDIVGHCQAFIKSGVSDQDLEVHFNPKTKRVNILVRLNVTKENLPLFEDVDCRLVFAGLLYVFGTNGNIISQSLSISPYLRRVLGSHFDQLPVPPWNVTVDHKYVNELTMSLNKILQMIRENYANHRHIVSTLLDLYPKNVACFDEYSYSFVTLFFVVKQSRYVAQLNLESKIELVQFALDKNVGSPDDIVMYSDAEEFTKIEALPESDEFATELHEMLKNQITKFISNARNTASPTIL